MEEKAGSPACVHMVSGEAGAMGQSSRYVNSSVQEVGEISHTGLLREGSHGKWDRIWDFFF